VISSRLFIPAFPVVSALTARGLHQDRRLEQAPGAAALQFSFIFQVPR
jgi:hypothetical protein